MKAATPRVKPAGNLPRKWTPQPPYGPKNSKAKLRGLIIGK